jgi:hypothetical protein
VGDTTGSNENHTVSSVVVLDVVGKLGSGDVADVLARAENGAAKGLVLESSGVEVIENNLLDLLLNLLGLSEDNVALTLDGGLLELGVLENIGENVDTLRNIRVESLGEVDGVFALGVVLVSFNVVSLHPTDRSVGVQVTTHVLDLQLQLLLSSLGGALVTLLMMNFGQLMGCRTLKARCSRKWAVPLVSSVSAREPASIQTPTVDVCAKGECSVAT